MSRRLPPWAIVWGVPIAVVLGVLLIRNAFLFSTPEYEDADMGANSILIEQARRFTLLVGNYSREGFNHPGPAFLYVQSWGESLFYDVFHVVPTPWNGQIIAVYVLNALFAASVVAIGYGWTKSVRGAAVTLAAALLFAVLHPSMFSSDWMPYVYMPAYFAFVVAIASVAAGRTQDSWIAALSGWFLINGHACFLFIVPVLVGGALAFLLWQRISASDASDASEGERGTRRLRLRFRLPRPRRRVWVPVAVISAVLAFPMIVELALHWPGNFGKYFGYSSSSRSGGHGARQVVLYALWFWWPHAHAWAVAVLLVAVAAVGVWRLPGGPLRRFCLSLLAADALSTAVFVAYAAVGIDALNDYYIGYFYWSAPVIAILVIALSATELLSSAKPRWRLGPRAGTGVAGIVAVTVAVAACAAFAVAPQTRLSTDHVDPAIPSSGPPTDPSIPAAVTAMARVAAGRPVIIRFDHNAWPTITGILVQAERTGVTACVPLQSWAFMMTSQFICTPEQRANGRGFYVYLPGQVRRGVAVVARLRRGIVTAGGK